MDIYRKLRQLIRLKSEAPIHQLVEHHDLAILEQDLRDTQALIKQHKLQLAGTRADIKLIAQDCETRQQTITRLEELALAAMHENHEEAENLASHIAEEETYLVEQKDRLRQLRDAEQRMLREITQAARLVQQSQHQLIVLRANESLHGKRGGQHAHDGLRARMAELKSDMQDIQARQQRAQYLDEARWDIEQNMEANAHYHRVVKHAISPSDVLARLSARASHNPQPPESL